jgi:hypothetical protein
MYVKHIIGLTIVLTVFSEGTLYASKEIKGKMIIALTTQPSSRIV